MTIEKIVKTIVHRKERDYYEKNYKINNGSNPWFSNRWFCFSL